jgi:hypothetical protein
LLRWILHKAGTASVGHLPEGIVLELSKPGIRPGRDEAEPKNRTEVTADSKL